MKVAVLGGYAPSLPHFRGPMIRAMVQAGHEVVAMAPGHDPVIVEKLAALGATYREVPLGRTGMNPLEDLKSIQALTATFREVRPDLLLSYTIKPVIYGSIAAARAGVPRRHAMITGLGSALMGEGFKMRCISAITRFLYRRGMARNQGVFFQNPDDRAFFEGQGLLPADIAITLINGSGVDLAHFTPAPLPEGPATFLLVARLTRDKGLLEFVEAARLVKAKHPEVRCQVLGMLDTNPTAISKAEVDAWQSEGVIEYLGTTKDVRPFLAAAHAMVLPSYGEGTPRSVLEAMATGRAIVTTTAPGCKETVVPGENGFLVPVKAPAALAAAMLSLIEDKGLLRTMGEASLRMARDKYDVHKVNAVILGALGLQ